MNFKNSTQTFIVVILIIVSALGGYFAGKNEIAVAWDKYKNRPHISVQNLAPAKDFDDINFTLFFDVYKKLQESYFNKKDIEPQKLYYGAISGMVAALGDPYTAFLPPAQNKEVKDELAGHFDGIGAQLGVKDKKIIVIAPLKESPAEKAGIKAADWIIKVDGQDTFNWTLPEAVSKIRGPKGTKVTLEVLHEDELETSEIIITRDTIKIKSVEWDKKEKNGRKVAVITLSRFGEGTELEWERAVSEVIQFRSDNVESFAGIVLDVRNNPGGFLNGAVFITSEFLADGPVVLQEDASGTQTTLSVNRVGKLLNYPLIVLINKGSASASEIVAGALSDRNRAKLIGEKSFGKGTIQEPQDLAEGAGLHITVQKWLTPNGSWVNEKEGISPDIEVKRDSSDLTKDTQLEKAVEELVK